MSVRTRLAVGVAVLVALSIALSGLFSVQSSRRELRAEVDDFLVQRADQIVPILDVVLSSNGRRGSNDRQARFLEDLVNPDALTQVVNGSGEVVLESDPRLPVDDAVLGLSGRSEGRYRLQTVTVDSTEYRVIAASTDRQMVVMVARDLGETNRAVSGIARRTLLAGLIGTALAGLAAWLFASRIVRPLGQLTAAAEQVAVTQDLSKPIDIDRPDEVGRLATSFNTMLGALDTSRKQQHRLVMDASHELRTPLTSLRTNIDFLHRAQTLDADARAEVLADLSTEVEELSALTAELVDLATASDRPDEPIVPLELNAVAEAAAERARRRFDREITVMQSGGTVEAAESLLTRAVNNLVHNACKFSPAGTPIEIAVTGGRVAVRDHGPGIPAADRGLVFDRFYRTVEARTEPGSGLGLAIVHEVVTRLGGRVFVEDPVSGAGVVVGFEIPTTGG